MAATAEQVSRMRRMCAEPEITTYMDSDLAAVIESHPLTDSEGRDPTHTEWVATYDMHAAATDIWQEKAAALASAFDFGADGGTYSRSQLQENALKQARYHNARRAAVGAQLITTTTADVELPTA